MAKDEPSNEMNSKTGEERTGKDEEEDEDVDGGDDDQKEKTSLFN